MSEYKPMWRLEQKADFPNTLQMYVYGDVQGDYYSWRTDMVVESETSANHFREELAKYPNVENIDIFINSCGGSVFEGTAIYNQLRRHSAYKTVYVDGFAISIASIIAMAGDKVVMPRNAMMMIHHAQMPAYGNSKDLRKAADDLDQINAGNRQAYLLKAGDKLQEDVLVGLLDDESYLTAERCIELGLADEYGEKDADLTLMKNMLVQQNLNLEQNLAARQLMIQKMHDLSEFEVIKPKVEQKKNLFFLFEKF